MLLWSHPTCYNHSLLFPHLHPAARVVFKRIKKSYYPPAYSPQTAPIATRINTKLITQKLPSASPLPVFHHILFNVFVFLLPIACTHSVLGLLYLMFPLSGMLPPCIGISFLWMLCHTAEIPLQRWRTFPPAAESVSRRQPSAVSPLGSFLSRRELPLPRSCFLFETAHI